MKKKEEKGFVWYGLRWFLPVYILSIVFILIFVKMPSPPPKNSWVDLIELLTILINILGSPFLTVVSIIHLMNYKERRLAILAIILSGATTLYYFILITTFFTHGI